MRSLDQLVFEEDLHIGKNQSFRYFFVLNCWCTGELENTGLSIKGAVSWLIQNMDWFKHGLIQNMDTLRIRMYQKVRNEGRNSVVVSEGAVIRRFRVYKEGIKKWNNETLVWGNTTSLRMYSCIRYAGQKRLAIKIFCQFWSQMAAFSNALYVNTSRFQFSIPFRRFFGRQN